YGLVFHHGRWYLIAFDHRAEEIRTFRIDRVLTVEQRDGSFQRPDGFDPMQHLMQALAAIPWGIEIEVLLETTMERARARLPADRANLEASPDGVVLRVQTDDLPMAAHYLAGIGC